MSRHSLHAEAPSDLLFTVFTFQGPQLLVPLSGRLRAEFLGLATRLRVAVGDCVEHNAVNAEKGRLIVLCQSNRGGCFT
ncbi:hypothetical protein DPMN_180179 [Dreissena polymorpha]|uniref:Uncharacterized protein n=1 Tax=Dreissena polymorpha TaxID=45954 RepID=A0A9D4EGH0_DREPO|nr:hypothetical protein DPMN_180179 [Dreissena polymorpha]